MKDSNISEPIVPPTQNSPILKDYKCPHCNKLLFKGNIKKLNMVCHHCQKMVNADDAELSKLEQE